MQLSNELASPISLTTNGQNNNGVGLNSNFPVQQQMMNNWCWAASTIAICAFYNDPNVLSQKQLVAQVTGKAICGIGPLIPFCDDTADLGNALQSVGHLDQSFDQALDAITLQGFLQQNRPVGCQLYLPSLGGGHAVVIAGSYSDAQGQLLLQIADPSDGSLLVMPYSQLLNNFRNTGGTWIRSYSTH